MPVRTGRFKKSILDSKAARDLAQSHESQFTELFQKSYTHDSELIAALLVHFHRLHYGKTWKGAKHSDPDLQNLLPFTDPNIETFRLYTLKSLPLSVARSLCFWRTGRFHLKLLNYKPSPFDLLKMQVNGHRCISLLNEDWGAFIDGERDVFSFVIHDLIHADHFFSQPELYELQKSFYRDLLDLFSEGFFEQAHLSEKSFHLIEYICSDMNSHPVHLMKTLKAALEIENPQLVPQLVEKTNWSSLKKINFLKLNTENEDENTHRLLMQSYLPKEPLPEIFTK